MYLEISAGPAPASTQPPLGAPLVTPHPEGSIVKDSNPFLLYYASRYASMYASLVL